MDLVIFTECPTRDYFRGLLKLKPNARFIDSRSFYLLFLKIYSEVYLLRKIGSFFGKPLEVKKVYWNDILWSFFGYFYLIFTRKKVVALFAPYSWIAVYLFVIRSLGTKVVYMTSWPYWNGRDYVFKPNKIKLFFWKNFLKNIDCVTISKSAEVELRKYTSNILQIPHAVDLNLFSVGKKDAKFKVLYVGRIIEEKGIQGILNVARVLGHIEFEFVGSGSCDNLVRNCELKNVVYHGEIRDRVKLAKIFSSASVFVLNSYKVPRWEELYGIVLLEALASGTCVICTDCVGPREIVKKEFGFLIRQHDEKALKEKIEFLYENPKQAVKMGLEGRKFVEENYDINVLAEKWNKILR
jgi:glycosyltransferase involved in cell wall biosynthesis